MLLLARAGVVDSLHEIIVVRVTRTVRGIATEVILTPDDWMPVACALNFDHLSLALRARLGTTLMTLADDRWSEVDRALRVGCGSGGA